MYIFHSTNVSCIPALVISILVAMGPGLLYDWFVDNRFSVFISAIAATMNVTSSTLQNINPEFNRTIWFSLMCGKYALTDAFIVRTFRLIFLYKHTLIFTLINLLICDDQLLYIWWESLSMMTSSTENIFRVTGPLCGEFTDHKGLVPRSFGVFFDLHLNKWLSKQSWGWWFETPS